MITKKRTILLLMAILYTSQLIGQKVTYHFELIENRIIIEMPYKDTMLNFIFDTGSNLSIIDTGIAEVLRLPLYDSVYIPSVLGSIQAVSTEFDLISEYSDMIWVKYPYGWNLPIKKKLHGLLGAYNLVRENNVEINFDNHIINIYKHPLETKPNNYKIDKTFSLFSINKSNEGLGKFMPKFPAICDTIIFSKNEMVIDLMIDTGSRFGLAFIAKDSTILDLIKTHKEKYSLMGKNESISFCSARIKGDKELTTFDSPIFIDALKTNELNNDFFGLLGVPFLKNYSKVILSWPDRTLYLAK